jgi:DNA replication protein DnaC
MRSHARYKKRVYLRHFYRQLDRLDLLIVDEMGYGRFSELGERLLFEVLRAGYERMSLVTRAREREWSESFMLL